jgi:hypothetical protein
MRTQRVRDRLEAAIPTDENSTESVNELTKVVAVTPGSTPPMAQARHA